MYDKLVVKVNNIDCSGFVSKTKYNADKTVKRIHNTSRLVQKSDYNAKISELEKKQPSISGLATTSALTAVENEIPSVSNLVKKTDYDTRISELEKENTDHKHDKYITTPEFNKLTAENFAAKLAQANLVRKTDLDNKLSSFNRKTISNKTKHLFVENKLEKLETFDSIYF